MLATEVVKKAPEVLINKWMILSIIELVIILGMFLFLFKKKQAKPDEFYVDENVTKFKDAEVDFGNMFNSMFNAQKIHGLLKKKIHPDLFPNDPEKISLANELTAQLNQSQNNIAKMEEIQAIAIEKLGIKI